MPAPLNPEILAAYRLAMENPAMMTPQRVGMFLDWKLDVAAARASTKQLAFADAFFDRRFEGTKKSIFAAIGGNRSGKTAVAGWLCFCLYLRECAVNGDTFWCVSQNLDRSITGQQRELWEFLPRRALVDQYKRQQTWADKIGFGGHRKITVKCKRGGKALIEFRSADQDPNTFEQAKLRGAWVDEACGEEIYNRLLARIIDLDGWIVFSDIRHQWWQEERLFGQRPESAVHAVQFCMRDNAHILPPGAIDQARANMTADEARMRIDGESGLSEGIVFKQFTAEQVVKPFPIPAHWPKWRMIDYGSSAPTACLWGTISPNEVAYIYRDFEEVSPSINHSAKMIKDKSPADEIYVATLIDPHAIDKPPAVYHSSPTVSEQFKEAGIETTGWPYIQVLGEHACVEKMKLRDERKTLKIFSTCTAHIRSRKNWKHKCDKNGNPVATDAYESENSHTIDCEKGWLATNPTYAQTQGASKPPLSAPSPSPTVREQESV